MKQDSSELVDFYQTWKKVVIFFTKCYAYQLNWMSKVCSEVRYLKLSPKDLNPSLVILLQLRLDFITLFKQFTYPPNWRFRFSNLTKCLNPSLKHIIPSSLISILLEIKLFIPIPSITYCVKSRLRLANLLRCLKLSLTDLTPLSVTCLQLETLRFSWLFKEYFETFQKRVFKEVRDLKQSIRQQSTIFGHLALNVKIVYF